MKWVAPIKDEMSIQRICSELEKIDQKYLVLFLVGIGTGLQLQEILNLRVRDSQRKRLHHVIDRNTGRQARVLYSLLI